MQCAVRKIISNLTPAHLVNASHAGEHCCVVLTAMHALAGLIIIIRPPSGRNKVMGVWETTKRRSLQSVPRCNSFVGAMRACQLLRAHHALVGISECSTLGAGGGKCVGSHCTNVPLCVGVVFVRLDTRHGDYTSNEREGCNLFRAS